jgi:hypothetical protein
MYTNVQRISTIEHHHVAASASHRIATDETEWEKTCAYQSIYVYSSSIERDQRLEHVEHQTEKQNEIIDVSDEITTTSYAHVHVDLSIVNGHMNNMVIDDV